MDKQAEPGAENSLTRLPIPLIGDINNRRFMTAVLAGILGGAGVSSAANLLRSYRELRNKKREETDDSTIVLTLPAGEKKLAADAYTSMKDEKPGEKKITAKCGKQLRDNGKYGKSLNYKEPQKPEVKCADDGNPGPNTVGTIVANTLGLTAGGLMSYEVVSRLFDAMNERRLKRKLKAAQQAYVNAMTGASKRAEAIMKVLTPVEHVIMKEPLAKTASPLDLLPDTAAGAVRYPMALYVLALLAGTGATSYVTKKVLDREFPEEKLKKDVNRPTRIVFRTEGSNPSLVEGEKGKEKQASAETCAALTAMLPIYMDVVEGEPKRTLNPQYVKVAEAAGTDPAGLMKMAKADMWRVMQVLLKDPMSIWEILKGTKFGLDFNMQNAAKALKNSRPDTYHKAIGEAIDSHFDGKWYGGLGKFWAKHIKGDDAIVDDYMKSASLPDIDVGSIAMDAFTSDKDDGKDETKEDIDTKAVVDKARRGIKSKRRLSVSGSDANAKAYIRKNRDVIRRIIAKLNAQGAL